MDLYFLRHGLAGDRAEWKGDDARRPLTKKGRAQLDEAGNAMACLGLEFDAILTSPLVRARQTAEIVANRLGASDRVREEARLEPGFGLKQLRDLLAGAGSLSALLLVGHEPDFGQTVSVLVGGGTLVMKKGGLARVELTSRRPLRGQLVWLVAPKLLRPAIGR